tara:strand:- start:436 stop:954 length:519 start_codon:yes stop_codon:yes gene_type:complete
MIYALGIGSNSNSKFGNKLNTLKFVLKELERNNIKVIKKSKLYSTPPKNFKSAAETFLNAALIVETKLKPKNLLIILKKIERITGRYTYRKNTSRTCDLDILLLHKSNKILINENKNFIEIPHPRLHERNFVLKPLLDICPEWLHSEKKSSITSLNKSLHIEDKIYKVLNTL